MKNSSTIISAFLLGAGIGAVFGILLAPAKGKETREKLMSGIADLSDLKDKIDELSDPNYMEHMHQQEEYDRMLWI